MSLTLRLWVLATLATPAVQPAAAWDAGDAIRLEWIEGDAAGISSILSPDGTSCIPSRVETRA